MMVLTHNRMLMVMVVVIYSVLWILQVNLTDGDVGSEEYSGDVGPGEEVRLMPLEDLSFTVASAFACACQLLVDFSCFPMYCTNYQKVLNSSKKGEILWIYS